MDLAIRGTEEAADDVLALTSPDAASRPATPLVLTYRGPAGGSVRVHLESEGTGALSFDPAVVDVFDGEPAQVRMFGDRAGAAEGDTSLVAHEGSTGGRVVGRRTLTVVSGIRIAFRGTFRFVIENNNGFTASMTGNPFSSCAGAADPPIWRATPLPCEGLLETGNEVRFQEHGSLPDRWALASGKRPKLEVLVTGVRAFGPDVDLDGRDERLRSGAIVDAPPEQNGIVGYLGARNCDADASTGNPSGQEDGIELVGQFGLRIGDVLTIKYRDSAAGTVASIRTKFPQPGSDDEDIDRADVNEVFFPDGSSGCSSPEMTFFDEDGGFVCKGSQSVRQLLLRNAGFRSMARRAWANWTSRKLVLANGKGGSSLIAALFHDLMVGRARNADTDPTNDEYAEAFLQLADYDWYTLMGRLSKGVLTTPGGIPAAFEEWTLDRGCPTPSEPTESFDADPFATAGAGGP